MVYKAAKWMGKIASHAVPGPSWEFRDMEEYRRAEDSAAQFTRSCQRIVDNEQELQKAYEEGYRSDPIEAVQHLEAKEKLVSTAAAERHTRLHGSGGAAHCRSEDERAGTAGSGCG
jgi:hypothetical protein